MKRSIVLIAMASLVFMACGDATNPDAEGAPTSTAATATITSASDDRPDTTASPRQASGGLTVERGSPLGQLQHEPAAGEVKLWVSNQSSADDPVGLAISIDGAQVVDEQFDVEGQHNWIAFDIAGLQPGRHEVAATSETGVEHTETFTVLEGAPRWLVLDYWYDRDDPLGRHITFRESDHAVAFD